MKRGHIAAVVAGASHPAPGPAVTADPAVLAARTIAGVDTGAARRAAADFPSALGIDVGPGGPKCLTILAPTISSSQRRHAAGPHRRVSISGNRGPRQNRSDPPLRPDRP